MKMLPVPENRLASLVPLITQVLIEQNIGERLDVEEAMEILHRGYQGGYTDVYVDNLDTPSHIIVLSRYLGGVDRGTITTVRLFYSIPSKRGNKEATSVMLNTIDNYAAIHGTEVLLASSWLYRGSRGIDDFWIANGFEVQETVYVKSL